MRRSHNSTYDGQVHVGNSRDCNFYSATVNPLLDMTSIVVLRAKVVWNSYNQAILTCAHNECFEQKILNLSKVFQ